MKQRFSILSGVLLCVCMLAFVGAAWGTTVLRLSEEQMVAKSSLIVRGKVVSQRAVAGPRGMGVVTLVTIQVQEELVGRQKPKTIVVRHFGGTLKGKTVAMIGGPSFKTGNEVVVFVQASKFLPKGEYLLVGLTQGKWQVVRPNTNASFPKGINQPMLVRNMGHLNMIQLKGTKFGTPTANKLTLSAMKLRLQTHYKTILARKAANILKLPKAKTGVLKLKKPVKVIRPLVRVAPTTPQKPVQKR
jgi:hypothetical protein